MSHLISVQKVRRSLSQFLLALWSAIKRGLQIYRLTPFMPARTARLTQQDTTLFARFFDAGIPFTIGTIDQRQNHAFAQSHDAKQVMRLFTRQRNRLPFPKRVLYIKTNL